MQELRKSDHPAVLGRTILGGTEFTDLGNQGGALCDCSGYPHRTRQHGRHNGVYRSCMGRFLITPM